MSPMKTPPSNSLSVPCYQIDHRSITVPTQTDRDGVDGVQELDGVHGDLRSEAKCTGATLFGKADWQDPRGTHCMKRDAAGLAGHYLAERAAIADRDLTMPKIGKVKLGATLRTPTAPLRPTTRIIVPAFRSNAHTGRSPLFLPA